MNKLKHKRIILAYPNCRWNEDWEERTIWNLHPYNICLLAATLANKYDVSIIDANFEALSREAFSNIIQQEKPMIVGISVLTNEYSQSGLAAAEIIKNIDPNITIVVGGVSATSRPLPLINNQNVDYVVVGEGEKVFEELCGHILDGASLPQKGIMFKKGEKIIDLGRAEFIEDLNSLPLPAYEKVDFMKYATSLQRESVDRPRDVPYANMITSRGCPFRCCFCEAGKISGKNVRLRTVENILNEMIWLKEKYGIKALLFDDDNLVFDKDRAKRLFKQMIAMNIGLKWNAIAMAAYRLDEEMISLMKNSGCQYVNIAIESGVERVLEDIIHKPLKLSQAIEVSSLLKKYKIDFAANFIIGFPGETWSEIRETIKFAEEYDADYTKIFIATPLPNTELYDLALKGGYLNKGFGSDRHLWTDGCIDTEEFRSKDLKILRAYEWDRINFSNYKKRAKIADIMGISLERLEEIRKNTLMRANP
jgi:anaerobic magnesium-protoporphyrin IX monomethyl ester cyclase